MSLTSASLRLACGGGFWGFMGEGGLEVRKVLKSLKGRDVIGLVVGEISLSALGRMCDVARLTGEVTAVKGWQRDGPLNFLHSKSTFYFIGWYPQKSELPNTFRC